MVTGASTANLAIVLVDARTGIVEQTRRHAFIASLLRIPHLILAVNKMDLVDYREEVCNDIAEQFSEFASRLEIPDIKFVPISALRGDNVVERSTRMPWFRGSTLLHELETVYIGSDANHVDPRFPVQWVIRPNSDEHHDFRGLAGRIAGGCSSRATTWWRCPRDSPRGWRNFSIWALPRRKPSRRCRR
jgi:sulfate adenylyltransferase subunit 1